MVAIPKSYALYPSGNINLFRLKYLGNKSYIKKNSSLTNLGFTPDFLFHFPDAFRNIFQTLSETLSESNNKIETLYTCSSYYT